jgi:hypothetical protein
VAALESARHTPSAQHATAGEVAEQVDGRERLLALRPSSDSAPEMAM